MGNFVPVSENECCGCGSCVHICSVNAITMQENNEGFMYPVIDEEKCLKCGKCINKCAFYNKTKSEETKKNKAFVVKHNNDDIRLKSRSGAVFVACSDWILKQNGSVYGCILDEKFKAIHIRATGTIERDLMCKSKYVQSNTESIFNDLKEDLEQNKKVLFSGTGCQVDAIINYLKELNVNMKNLYTMDVVCHGVVSPKIFKDYLLWIEKKYNAKVEEFDFRDKSVCGWDGHIESFVVNGKKMTSTIYRQLFYTDLGLRKSCYNCKYANLDRISDISIADAWGIKKVKPEFNDNKGVSLCLIQGEKGEELFNCIKGVCSVEEVEIKDMMQHNLMKPTILKNTRNEFWREYDQKGIDGIIKKYGILKIHLRAKEKIKYRIRQLVQRKKQYLP